ncbi:hypothetical protein LTR72_011268 [Exophiala xenobiotica]|nr:hypothetical protein LTR92_010800 [Exophiala xenobiotica]KAK5215683.1 hypothetical protein LTR72_011268 [Exophiala xenobiotica]KAK5284991.1 hypothetical protein LTR14_011322 [Exophiala xenobiotica]
MDSKRPRPDTASGECCKRGKLDISNGGQQSCLNSVSSTPAIETASPIQDAPYPLGDLKERFDCLSVQELCDHKEDDDPEAQLAVDLYRFISEALHGNPVASSLRGGSSMRSLMIGLAPEPWVLDALKAQPSIAVEYMRFTGTVECDVIWDKLPRYDLIILLDAERWLGQPSEFIMGANRQLNPGGILEIRALGMACFTIGSAMKLTVNIMGTSRSDDDLSRTAHSWKKALDTAGSEATLTQFDLILKHKEVYPGAKSWHDTESLELFCRYVELSQNFDEGRQILQRDDVHGSVMHFVIRGK